MGFDWTIPQTWQRLRDREKSLTALKQGAKEGAFGEIIGKAADLRTQVTLAEEHARQMQTRLASFKVLPEYHALEQEASQLTREINELANQNTLDRQLLAELEQSIASESPPPMADLEAMYREVGIILPAPRYAASTTSGASMNPSSTTVKHTCSRRWPRPTNASLDTKPFRSRRSTAALTF